LARPCADQCAEEGGVRCRPPGRPVGRRPRSRLALPVRFKPRKRGSSC